MTLALARKYRPKNFESVAVQSHVSNSLKGAILRERIAHGYLLCGPRGVGKTTLARVLAMALNCERRRADGEPCGECASCQRIWSGSASLDVVEIDAASNRGVDDARELRERAMYAPSGNDRWKVYIVDEAHMLTREAWNALLKILEEPPPRVVFVFATTEPHKIAQAAAPVLSRLQRFDLKRIGAADIRDRLSHVLTLESIEADADALAVIARAADGSMRDALSLTDQALALGDRRLTTEGVRAALGLVAEDEYLAVLDLVAEKRAGEIFSAVARLAEEGADLGQFLAGFADLLRAQLAVSLGAPPADLSDRVRAALEERKARLTSADLLRMLSAVAELEPKFRRSTQQQLLLEVLLVRFALLDRTVAIEELLRQVGGGEGESPARAPSLGTRPTPGGREGVRAQPATPREGREGRAETPGGVTRVAEDVAPPSRRAEAAPGPRAAQEPADTAAPRVAAPAPRQTSARSRADERRVTREPDVNGITLDINAIVGAWDDVVAVVRRDRPILGSMIEHCLPTAVTSGGVLTLQSDASLPVDSLMQKIGEVTDVLRARIPALERVVVRGADGAAATPARMSHETIRADTVTSLRKRDPVLGAAIDALDLELVD